jgi:hypothetical protein
VILRQNARSGSSYWVKDVRIDVPVMIGAGGGGALILGANQGFGIIPTAAGSQVPIIVDGSVNTNFDLGYNAANGQLRWFAHPNITYQFNPGLWAHNVATDVERTEYGTTDVGRLLLAHLPLTDEIMYVR